MSTTITNIATEMYDRRSLLKLAAAAMLVAAGCTRVRPESDLDAAMSDLNQLIDEMGDNEQQRVTSLAQRIQSHASKLADEHRTFTDTFDRLLSRYDTTEAELDELTDAYNRNRMLKRNDLLHLQDELHHALKPDEWAEVVRVLNRAGKSLAVYTLSGS